MSFEPKTSKEKYLATQAGLYDGDLPAPKTNEEYYLKEMAENPSSGGGVMYVTVDEETGALSKNYAEIASAVESGQFVALHLSNGPQGLICPLTGYVGHDDPEGVSLFAVEFALVEKVDGTVTVEQITFANTESATAPLVEHGPSDAPGNDAPDPGQPVEPGQNGEQSDPGGK